MLQDQKFFLNELIKFLIEQKADALIIAGDIYDRTVPSSDAVELVDNTFKTIINQVKIPIFVIAGNHDCSQRLSFANSLIEKSGLYIEGEIKEKIKKICLNDQFGEINFYLMPFINFYEMKSEIDGIKTYNDAVVHIFKNHFKDVDYKKRNVLIAHGYFRYLDNKNIEQDNIVFGKSETSVGGSDLCNIKPFEKFDYIALGHLHSPQGSKFEHIRYSGSLLKYSIDEATQKKSITVVELNEKSDINISQHTIKPLRDLREIKGDFNSILDGVDYGNKDDYIFVNIVNDEPIVDAISRLKSVYPNILGLRYQSNNQSSTNVYKSEEIKDKKPIDLFCDFYKSTSNDKLDDEQINLVKDIFDKLEVEV